MKIDGVRIELKSDEIKSENLSGAYRELADIIGIEAVVKIHASYRGQTVCFPVDLFNRDFIASRVVDDYNSGMSVKKLATKYGYSEKSIRKMLKSTEK